MGTIGAVSGGGFFYSAFTKLSSYTGLLVTPGVGVQGAWHRGIPPWISPHPVRYVNVSIENTSLAVLAPYYIQLGKGPAGSEVLWQPSVISRPLQPDYNGFFVLWVPPFDTSWKTPYTFIFPCSLREGEEISVRGMVPAGVALPFTASIYLSN